ncbi:hypothetical protein [Oleidesulfovibrio sp.]|uniref:hypothetical protein n=1 Tax=Oleidesulfovibrio sp. TaxID=2909707 RepID=UPI003A8819F7
MKNQTIQPEQTNSPGAETNTPCANAHTIHAEPAHLATSHMRPTASFSAGKATAVLCMLLLCISLFACGGRGGPREKLLRVDTGSIFRPQSETYCADNTMLHLRLYEVGTLAGLNRTAVLIAKGNVLTPSTTWHWEGTPPTLFTQALENETANNPYYDISAHPRSRNDLSGILRVSITAFEVVAEAPYKVRGGARIELWTADETSRIDMTALTFEEPIERMEGDLIAKAASQVLSKLSGQTRAWLETSALRALPKPEGWVAP